MKQKVVVIGHGYTSRLGVIRALGRAGYEVIVIVMTFLKKDGKEANVSKPIDCYSKFVSQVFYCVTDEEKLIQLLLDKCIDKQQKVVVIPDSDFSAATIDLNQDRLKDHFLFPHINHEQGAIVEWMDKIRQKETADRVGLDVAKGWLIQVKDGIYTIPLDLRYPCFPKPLATLVGAKTGLGKCDSEKDLRKAIDLLIKRSSTISILVEEYKKIEAEHALLGLSDGKNVVIPFSETNLPAGKYIIAVTALDENGNPLQEPYDLIFNYRPVEVPDTGGGSDADAPNTGGIMATLNVSKTDYLITGLLVFTIVGIVGASVVLKERKTDRKKRR